MKIKTKTPDKKWRELLNEKGFTRNYPFKNKRLEPLKRKLLKIGGWAVCLPDDEQDLDEYFERGIVLNGKSRLELGQACRCHSNSARIWKESKEQYKICTGYALSDDGVWRVHTWCVKKSKSGKVVEIIETTEKRIVYFGYTLSRMESAIFFELNKE